MSENQNVTRPSHYKAPGATYECIEEMVALFGVQAVKDFCRCNIYKYRYRATAKGGQVDLDKANQYVKFLVKLEAGEHGV